MCETCDRKETANHHKEIQIKNEPLPTRPTPNAIDGAGEMIRQINARLGYTTGDPECIDKIDPQEWVNLYHQYRVTYENLKRIGDLLHERKIIARLKHERDTIKRKTDKKREASKRVGATAKKSPEDKQRERLRLLNVSEEQIDAILAKAAQNNG